MLYPDSSANDDAAASAPGTRRKRPEDDPREPKRAKTSGSEKTVKHVLANKRREQVFRHTQTNKEKKTNTNKRRTSRGSTETSQPVYRLFPENTDAVEKPAKDEFRANLKRRRSPSTKIFLTEDPIKCQCTRMNTVMATVHGTKPPLHVLMREAVTTVVRITGHDELDITGIGLWNREQNITPLLHSMLDDNWDGKFPVIRLTDNKSAPLGGLVTIFNKARERWDAFKKSQDENMPEYDNSSHIFPMDGKIGWGQYWYQLVHCTRACAMKHPELWGQELLDKVWKDMMEHCKALNSWKAYACGIIWDLKRQKAMKSLEKLRAVGRRGTNEDGHWFQEHLNDNEIHDEIESILAQLRKPHKGGKRTNFDSLKKWLSEESKKDKVLRGKCQWFSTLIMPPTEQEKAEELQKNIKDSFACLDDLELSLLEDGDWFIDTEVASEKFRMISDLFCTDDKLLKGRPEYTNWECFGHVKRTVQRLFDKRQRKKLAWLFKLRHPQEIAVGYDPHFGSEKEKQVLSQFLNMMSLEPNDSGLWFEDDEMISRHLRYIYKLTHPEKEDWQTTEIEICQAAANQWVTKMMSTHRDAVGDEHWLHFCHQWFLTKRSPKRFFASTQGTDEVEAMSPMEDKVSKLLHDLIHTPTTQTHGEKRCPKIIVWKNKDEAISRIKHLREIILEVSEAESKTTAKEDWNFVREWVGQQTRHSQFSEYYMPVLQLYELDVDIEETLDNAPAEEGSDGNMDDKDESMEAECNKGKHRKEAVSGDETGSEETGDNTPTETEGLKDNKDESMEADGALSTVAEKEPTVGKTTDNRSKQANENENEVASESVQGSQEDDGQQEFSLSSLQINETARVSRLELKDEELNKDESDDSSKKGRQMQGITPVIPYSNVSSFNENVFVAKPLTVKKVTLAKPPKVKKGLDIELDVDIEETLDNAPAEEGSDGNTDDKDESMEAECNEGKHRKKTVSGDATDSEETGDNTPTETEGLKDNKDDSMEADGALSTVAEKEPTVGKTTDNRSKQANESENEVSSESVQGSQEDDGQQEFSLSSLQINETARVSRLELKNEELNKDESDDSSKKERQMQGITPVIPHSNASSFNENVFVVKPLTVKKVTLAKPPKVKKGLDMRDEQVDSMKRTKFPSEDESALSIAGKEGEYAQVSAQYLSNLARIIAPEDVCSTENQGAPQPDFKASEPGNYVYREPQKSWQDVAEVKLHLAERLSSLLMQKPYRILPKQSMFHGKKLYGQCLKAAKVLGFLGTVPERWQIGSKKAKKCRDQIILESALGTWLPQCNVLSTIHSLAKLQMQLGNFKSDAAAVAYQVIQHHPSIAKDQEREVMRSIVGALSGARGN